MYYLINTIPIVLICLTLLFITIYLTKNISKIINNNIINKKYYTVDHFETTIATLNNIIGTFYSVIIQNQLIALEPIKYGKDNIITKEYRDKVDTIFKKNIDILIKTFIPTELYNNCSHYFTSETLGLYIYNKFGILSNEN